MDANSAIDAIKGIVELIKNIHTGFDKGVVEVCEKILECLGN